MWNKMLLQKVYRTFLFLKVRNFQKVGMDVLSRLPAVNTIKGAVHWNCFGVKPFNITACFIMKCGAKYYYSHQNGRPWTIAYNNVRALVTFISAYISINWRQELYMR